MEDSECKFKNASDSINIVDEGVNILCLICEQKIVQVGVFEAADACKCSNGMFMGKKLVPPLKIMDFSIDDIKAAKESPMDEAVQSILLENQGYIKIATCVNKYFVCTCCVSTLTVSTNLVFPTHLLPHLAGKKHRKMVKSGVKDCKEMLIRLSWNDVFQSGAKSFDDKRGVSDVLKKVKSKNSTMRLNHRFILDKDGQFFCAICEVSVPFSEAGQQLVEHCMGTDHSDRMNEKFDAYLAGLDDEEGACGNSPLDGQREMEEELESLKKEPWPTSLKLNLKLLKVKDGLFTCTICQTPIAFEQEDRHVTNGHFFTRSHTMGLYNVFCEGASGSLETSGSA